jgi:hypothetical protein
MKLKIIIIVLVLLLGGAGIGGYFYYDSVLRFTDDFTDCPVLAFRAAATTPEAAVGFVSEASMSSLKITERCSLDCMNGNHMACVIYGIAQQEGVFVVQSASGSQETLSKACNRGESLACQLEQHAKDKAEQEAKAVAVAAAREKFKGTLRDISKARDKVGRVIADALGYYSGNKGPMVSGSMTKWYTGTARYLLYDKPSLSQMHKLDSPVKGKPPLKEFVLTKYMGGTTEPNFGLIQEFFEKFMRLGVQQIKLDYYVEKKKESQIPKRHGYFRAKHCFLYNAGQVYLEVIELLEKDINYRIEQAS